MVSQCPSSVVHRAASTIALKAYSFYTPGPMEWYGNKYVPKHLVSVNKLFIYFYFFYMKKKFDMEGC